MKPAPAFNVVDPPVQNDKLPVIVGVGLAFIVVVAVVLPEQLFAFVTVTVKVPAVLTKSVCVVAPVDHK